MRGTGMHWAGDPAQDDQSGDLPLLVQKRVENLFSTGVMACAPAMFFTLNQAFGGGLSRELVEKLTAPFVQGMGSGCACGGLIGAEMALGLFLGRGGGRAWRGKEVSRAARIMHDFYQSTEGAVCCRLLCKKGKQSPGGQFQACIRRIGPLANAAARIILQARPELASRPLSASLSKREGRVRSLLKRCLVAVLE